MKLFLHLLVFCIFAIGVSAQELSSVHIHFQKRIPNAEGIQLSANVYLPSNTSERRPALLALTPYGVDNMHADAMWYAERGYAVVIADCRGRGNSEGRFVPFEYDGSDAYDICRWIGKQEWSNGKVGMFGGSYLGMIQWLAMAYRPKELRTIVPTAAVAPGIDFPFFNNIFYTYNAKWLALTLGRTTAMNAFRDAGYWNSVFRRYFTEHTPYADINKLAGISTLIFRRWLTNPTNNQYWQELLPSVQDYSYADIPILSITGHFDDDQRGALHYYNSLNAYASQQAVNAAYLVIGPWNHAGTHHPVSEYKNMTFGENAAIDMRYLHLEWFDWTLRDKEKPVFLQSRVACYEMGTNQWLYADSLDGITDTSDVWYTQPVRSGVNSVFNSGTLLSELGGFDQPTEFDYDPLDTTMVDDRFQETLVDFAWRAEREAFFPEKVVFHSPPLNDDLYLTGKVKFDAYISLNVNDTDFEVILYEIKPDGTCEYLTSDIKRARYNNSLEEAIRVPKNDIVQYTFDTFHFISKKIPKGSRLRLVFGALHSPYYQKNFNSGKSVETEGYEDAREATIKLFHGKKYPTALTLPLRRR